MRPSPTRAGYTLTEVLIATMLIVVLMTACWNLMSLYGSFLKAGREEVAERQLARSLFQLVEHDVRLINAPTARVQKQAAVPLRVPELTAVGDLFAPGADVIAMPTNSTDTQFKTDNTVRFEGTSDWLSVTFLAESVLPQEPPVGEVAAQSLDSETDDETARPSGEAHTVLYFFNEPQSVLPTDQVLPSGLHRVEATTFDLQDARQQNAAEQVGGVAASSNAVFSRLAYDALFEPDDELTAALDEAAVPGFDPIHDHAPEVVRVEFQYHDGQRWQARWNTHNRRSLPTMVRVSWWIVSADELQTIQETLDAEALDEEEPETLPGIRPRRYQRTFTLAPLAIPEDEDFGGAE